jgi:hypothetical protein
MDVPKDVIKINPGSFPKGLIAGIMDINLLQELRKRRLINTTQYLQMKTLLNNNG